MTITLRQQSDGRASTKGASLTFAELDNNFIDLLNRATLTVEDGSNTQVTLGNDGSKTAELKIVGAGGLTTSVTSDSTGQAVLTLTQAAAASATLNVVAGTGITVSQPDSAGEFTVTNSITAINDLSDVTITTPSTGQILSYGPSGWANGAVAIQYDTTPILGGNLDVNGNSIVSISNGNITITPNGTGKTKVSALNYNEGSVYSLGTTSGTITPDVANGNVQTITLNGNLTFSAFSNAVAGQSMTLIVIQDATGSRTLTSTMKFAGAEKTLSTAANSIDILSVFYTGSVYYASLSKGFA